MHKFLLLVYSITGLETAAELNKKARRLKQRERTYAKNKAAVLEYLQDGNFNNFVKRVRKTRDDRIQDDPILVELWHEACVMKKVVVVVNKLLGYRGGHSQHSVGQGT